ncbi:MAG: TAXI family TRAP transporter solute-binding subunit [Nautiliaceae bacterium]
MIKKLILVSFASLAFAIVIGTGNISGIYYPAGGSICYFVNKNTNLRCLVDSTNGSGDNINKIQWG